MIIQRWMSWYRETYTNSSGSKSTRKRTRPVSSDTPHSPTAPPSKRNKALPQPSRSTPAPQQPCREDGNVDSAPLLPAPVSLHGAIHRDETPDPSDALSKIALGEGKVVTGETATREPVPTAPSLQTVAAGRSQLSQEPAIPTHSHTPSALAAQALPERVASNTPEDVIPPALAASKPAKPKPAARKASAKPDAAASKVGSTRAAHSTASGHQSAPDAPLDVNSLVRSVGTLSFHDFPYMEESHGHDPPPGLSKIKRHTYLPSVSCHRLDMTLQSHPVLCRSARARAAWSVSSSTRNVIRPAPRVQKRVLNAQTNASPVMNPVCVALPNSHLRLTATTIKPFQFNASTSLPAGGKNAHCRILPVLPLPPFATPIPCTQISNISRPHRTSSPR